MYREVDMYHIVVGECGVTLLNHFGAIVDEFESVSDARDYVGEDPAKVWVVVLGPEVFVRA